MHLRNQQRKSPAARLHPANRTLSNWLVGALLSLLAFGAAAAPRELWRLDDTSASHSTKARRPGVHPLQFDARALAEWPAGEPGTFALPGGRTYEIVADRVEAHANGNRSWIGRFEVDGEHHVAVLTFGPAGLVGEVRTPGGLMVIARDGARTTLVDVREAGWETPPTLESDAIAPLHLTGSTHTHHPSAAIALKATPSPQITIDVLFAYTDGLLIREGSTAAVLLRLNQLIATANQAYVDSEIAVTLRLVHAVQVAYTDANSNSTALSDLTNGTGTLAAAKGTLRDRYGADIVVLVRPFRNPEHQGCGVAWVGGYGGNGANIGAQSSIGYSVISDGTVPSGNGGFYYCPDSTFPHEVGHLMGAMHDMQTVTASSGGAVETGAYNYSYGYTRNAQFSGGTNTCAVSNGTCFGTIMSYISTSQLLRFSNPLQTSCGGGQACGSPSADVTRTLNNTRIGVAGWRSTKLPLTGSQQGTPQTAGAGAAFTQPLRVIVRDAANALVPGVTVRFAAPAGGASATLSATSVITDVNGVAAVTATAGSTAGTYLVTATANPDFVATSFSFQLTNQGATTVPGAPGIVAVSAGNATATVTFTAPASDGGSAITGYAVTSNPAGGSDTNAGSTQTSHAITGLANGVAYTFTVTATNARGTSAASAASGSVTPATVPGAPVIGGASAGNAAATVTFQAPSTNGGAAITGYTVTSTPAGGVDSGAGTLTLSRSITGLSNGIAYTFRVTATNARGAGAPSAASNSVTPAAPAPAAVQRTITVARAGSGGGAVASNDQQVQCGVTCTRTYPNGTTLTLTATPAAGSVFTGWLGACTGKAPCALTLNRDVTVSATFAPSTIAQRADVDGNSRYEALTDGVMLIRYMFGLNGAPLTSGVVGTNPTRSTPEDIRGHLDNLKPLFDIDGNGDADALTDGVLVLRYLFGLRGAPLLVGAVGVGPTRSTAAQIEGYIQTLLP